MLIGKIIRAIPFVVGCGVSCGGSALLWGFSALTAVYVGIGSTVAITVLIGRDIYHEMRG